MSADKRNPCITTNNYAQLEQDCERVEKSATFQRYFVGDKRTIQGFRHLQSSESIFEASTTAGIIYANFLFKLVKI